MLYKNKYQIYQQVNFVIQVRKSAPDKHNAHMRVKRHVINPFDPLNLFRVETYLFMLLHNYNKIY